jgi:FAD dependent oxidoreductase/OmpA family
MANDRENPAPRTTVAVFGGGITGLTAAHELAERGFDVTVYEEAEDATAPSGTPAVGGMARTQWSWWPQPLKVSPTGETFQRTHPLPRIPWKIPFKKWQSTLAEDAIETLKKVAALLKDNPAVQTLDIESFACNEGGDDLEVAGKRAQVVCDALKRLGVSQHQVQVLVTGAPPDRFLSDDEQRYVGFSVRGTALAGEHGYRYFPSFYYHLFDTMKRTPLMRPVRATDLDVARRKALLELGAQVRQPPSEATLGTEYEETGSTAYDNLRPMPSHAIAPEDDRPPTLLPRTVVTSLEELRGLLNAFFRDLGFSWTDVAIFNAKILKFATSCDARRRQKYAAISWARFIDSPSYSRRFKEAMDRWPKALVALRADECDAYTHGVVTLQLLLDQFRKEFTDGTLVGPTSEVWLEPWRVYLSRRLGVQFERARLRHFCMKEGGLHYEYEAYGDDGSRTVYTSKVNGYCVVALPVERVAAVFKPDVLRAVEQECAGRRPSESARRRGPAFPESDDGRGSVCPDPKRNDVKLTVDLSQKLGGDPPAPEGGLIADESQRPQRWALPTPPGALQHFAGIQFYFLEDVNWVQGHTYYIDSPWGLSSIAQTDQWSRKASRREGYRAIVSVVIGIFDQPGKFGKTVWECSPEELAKDVWRQIKEGAESERLRLPDPSFYHVDENLVFKSRESGPIVRNASPFLVPLVGTWDERPGEPEDYRVYLNSLVMAGTYMKTHTRLTTMEAANESARHAVNAILWHRYQTTGRVPGVLCETKSMAEREAPDAAFFKEIDQELFDRGLPHFMDILEWETWPSLPLTATARLARWLMKRV